VSPWRSPLGELRGTSLKAGGSVEIAAWRAPQDQPSEAAFPPSISRKKGDQEVFLRGSEADGVSSVLGVERVQSETAPPSPKTKKT